MLRPPSARRRRATSAPALWPAPRVASRDRAVRQADPALAARCRRGRGPSSPPAQHLRRAPHARSCRPRSPPALAAGARPPTHMGAPNPCRGRCRCAAQPARRLGEPPAAKHSCPLPARPPRPPGTRSRSVPPPPAWPALGPARPALTARQGPPRGTTSRFSPAAHRALCGGCRPRPQDTAHFARERSRAERPSRAPPVADHSPQTRQRRLSHVPALPQKPRV